MARIASLTAGGNFTQAVAIFAKPAAVAVLVFTGDESKNRAFRGNDEMRLGVRPASPFYPYSASRDLQGEGEKSPPLFLLRFVLAKLV